ncbi:hypothetical protein ACL6C3_15055 [Capilliphycus salinus ALCB114379]|uniref:hypothetical protein n=1 Tax=Capilliphycus salinus TaxID=2768948 RepID=UPI0039A43853
MKCVVCGTDNNLQDRTANRGRCKNCNHQFTFDPKSGSRFTDIFFKNCLDLISANGTLYYTPKQLTYLLEKRLNRKSIQPGVSLFLYIILLAIFSFTGPFSFVIVSSLFCWNAWRQSNSSRNNISWRRFNLQALRFAGFFIIGIGIFLSFQVSLQPLAAFGLLAASSALGLLAIYLANTRLSGKEIYTAQSSLLSQRQVDEWMERWTRYNTVDKMLPPSVQQPTAGEINSEITSYSFDRVVICDHNEIAHLLIMNNFHFEHNCAVLSIRGYPRRIFNTVLEMLKRNPDLKVYAFHDASPSGVSLAHLLRTDPLWFGGTNIVVYDLGLLPRHVFQSRNMFIKHESDFSTQAKQIIGEVRRSLSDEELDWLEAGNYVELESFTPQRLLNILSNGIARSRTTLSGQIESGSSSIYDPDEDIRVASTITFSESFG